MLWFGLRQLVTVHHERASLTLKTVSFLDPLLLPAAEPYIDMNARNETDVCDNYRNNGSES